MTTDSSIATQDAASRLATIQDEIAKAARLTGRTADAITLIAISKTKDAAAIQPLIDAGQRVFGENRVQEAQEKWPALRQAHPDIRLHLVGQLQSNKAADADAADADSMAAVKLKIIRYGIRLLSKEEGK